MTSPLFIKKVEDYKIGNQVNFEKWHDIKANLLVDTISAKPIEKKAKFKLLWSEKGFFIFFEVRDDHIWGTMKNDDDPIYEEEVVECFLGKGSRVPTEYYEFQFSPNKIKFDAKIRNPTGNRYDLGFKTEVSWDAPNLRFCQDIKLADLHNKKYKPGIWFTEVFIPWSDLGWNIGEGSEIRGNFFRIDGYPKQSSFQAWQPTFEDPPNFHIPKRFGLLKLV